MCVSFWFVVQSTEEEMACRSSCVKIYLCSNPAGKWVIRYCQTSTEVCERTCLVFCADSVLERRALRERVFPRFRHHCRHTLGLDVRVSTHSTFHNHCTESLCCNLMSVNTISFSWGRWRRKLHFFRSWKLFISLLNMHSRLYGCVFVCVYCMYQQQ